MSSPGGLVGLTGSRGKLGLHSIGAHWGWLLPKAGRRGTSWPTGLPQLLQCVCQPEPGEHSSLPVSRHSSAVGWELLRPRRTSAVRHRGGSNMQQHLSRAEAATALTDAGHIQTPEGSRTPTGCTPPLTKCLGQPLWLPRSEGASARRERAHT